MSKLEVIDEILHEKFKHVDQGSLVEEDTDRFGKKFKVKYPIVKKPNINYSLYRYDSEALPFFKDINGLKKMCDYILFAEEANYLHVFVIELKLSNISAQKQLQASNEFVKFIINSAIRIGKEISNCKIKKVRICDSKINKRSLKDSKSFEFDANDYCEYQFNSFYLEPLMQY